jgi:hypothetical protein
VLVPGDRATIETYRDGTPGSEVIILPSYGRDGGADVEALATTLAAAGHHVLRPQPRARAGHNHRGIVAAVVLADASGHTVDPEVNSAPFRVGEPTLPKVERLAALRLALFAPDHDPSIWLTGWYPETLKMQHAAVTGIDLGDYWGAGDSPIGEIIAVAPRSSRGQATRSFPCSRRPSPRRCLATSRR